LAGDHRCAEPSLDLDFFAEGLRQVRPQLVDSAEWLANRALW